MGLKAKKATAVPYVYTTKWCSTIVSTWQAGSYNTYTGGGLTTLTHA